MPTKFTTETFIKKAIEVHGYKYDYSKTFFESSHINLTIICPIHGKFLKSPANHLYRKQGCPKCTLEMMSIKNRDSIKQFIRKGKKVHNDIYNYDRVVYINAHTKIMIGCSEIGHGYFPQTPNAHLRGSGCPICGQKERRSKRVMTLKEFIKRSKKIYNNKYDYSKVIYANSITNIIIICPIDGEFLQTPSNHLKGNGCRKCSARLKHPNQTITTEECINRAIKTHGNTYLYDKTIYKNSKTKMLVGCRKIGHGYFPQFPYSHFKGSGCPICRLSRGESAIAKMLENKNIKYLRQKTFKYCKNIRELKFDFYLSQLNMLIEFNGQQHYTSMGYWNKHGKSLEYQQHCDSIKKDYALSHGYRFLVIKYTDNIEEVLNKFLAESVASNVA
jgi:very-short-patch-repair endonuclease